MTLVHNPRWNAPEWIGPSKQLGELVQDFARRLEAIPGVRALWAIFEDGQIHFCTLIQSQSRDTEDELFGAELAFMDHWNEPSVVFHVSSDEESLSSRLRDVAPVLLPAP